MSIDEKRERCVTLIDLLSHGNLIKLGIATCLCPVYHPIHLRLRDLLEAEEKELLRELETKKETVLERQAKMRERAKSLRERRESDRQQVVADKLEQLFR